MSTASQKMYLISAIYDWCVDNEYTPYVTVLVDQGTQVPRHYVNDNKIILNISNDAVSKLNFTQDFLKCFACFDGKKFDISVPMNNIIAIYAKENGEGMSFSPCLKKKTLPPPNSLSKSNDKKEVELPFSLQKKDVGLKSTKNTSSLKNHLKLIK